MAKITVRVEKYEPQYAGLKAYHQIYTTSGTLISIGLQVPRRNFLFVHESAVINKPIYCSKVIKSYDNIDVPVFSSIFIA
jgi:hypothetical protein